MAYCGRVLQGGPNGAATLRIREGVGGFSGVQHCSSVWACPVCSARIALHRALDIGQTLGRAIGEGHPLGFFTFTGQHHRGQSLEASWAAIRKAWSASTTGGHWQKAKTYVSGWVRVWEVTWGPRNGWHPHAHGVLVLEQGTTEVVATEVFEGMWERFERALRRSGRRAVRHAQDFHLVEGERAGEDVAGYLVKLTDPEVEPGDALGLELTHGLSGRSRRDLRTFTPWALLDHFETTGEAGALDLWHEWEATSHGLRQIGWSKGLRERFGAEAELSDDEIANAEFGTAHDDVIRITSAGWAELIRQPMRCLDLIELLEQAGVQAVTAQLRVWGIEHEVLVEMGEEVRIYAEEAEVGSR